MSRVKLFNEIYKNHNILQECFENCEDNENITKFFTTEKTVTFFTERSVSQSVILSVRVSQSVNHSVSQSVSQSII